MAHFDKHSTSIKALVDVSEAMLNAMEQHGIDPETVANRNEFTLAYDHWSLDCTLGRTEAGLFLYAPAPLRNTASNILSVALFLGLSPYFSL